MAIQKRKTPREIPCPRCGRKYPRFSEPGKHNFVPTIGSDGEVEEICLDCKIEEIHASKPRLTRW